MPANAGSLLHVYNKAVERRNVFVTEEDSRVFISYLNDYLSLPKASGKEKKTFTIRGRTFSGTPHQPKNYAGKVELVAYSLSAQSFNLLLRENVAGSLERFIRSLCTRYSIYYNKKYNRSGSVFSGPYKTISVNGTSEALLLSKAFHKNAALNTSYDNYLGKRSDLWLNTSILNSVKSRQEYVDYVELYKLSSYEQEVLSKLLPEANNLSSSRPEIDLGTNSTSSDIPLERRDLKSDLNSSYSNNIQQKHSKLPAYFGAIAVFFVLSAFGVRNINISRANNLALDSKIPAPSVLSQFDVIDPVSTLTPSPVPVEVLESPLPTPLVETASESQPINVNKKEVVIHIKDGSKVVNIRSLPNLNAEKILEAKEGDAFEFISLSAGWYEVQLDTNTIGFVSGKYATVSGDIKTND